MGVSLDKFLPTGQTSCRWEGSGLCFEPKQERDEPRKCLHVACCLFPFFGEIYNHFVTINIQMQATFLFLFFFKNKGQRLLSVAHETETALALLLYFCGNWLLEEDNIWAWQSELSWTRGRNRAALSCWLLLEEKSMF